MNLKDIIEEYRQYENTNEWKNLFQNAKFDNESINLSCNIGRHSSNLKYNRYRDIIPYDHSRVILKDAGDNDYINANFVECKLAKRKYILTQGPLLTTCEHFWQMIWEQNSKGIIMLNRIIEKGARKCDVYYPNVDEDDSDLEMTFGKFQISYLSEQPCEDYVIRKLEVENLDLKETREVFHCHYTNWPDFGEPSDKSFLNFLFLCESLDLFNTSQQDQQSKPKYGPPIIHCSAGVGRSGTLALIDSILCLYKLHNETIPTPIMNVLSELRKGRMGLVQTHQQLKFAFESIIDGIKLLSEEKLNEKNNLAVGINENIVNEEKPASKKPSRSFSSDDDDDEEYREKIRRRKQKLLVYNNRNDIKTAKPNNKRPKRVEDHEIEDKIDDDDDSSDSNELFFAKTDRIVSTVKVNQKRKPAADLLLESNFSNTNVQNKETKSEIILINNKNNLELLLNDQPNENINIDNVNDNNSNNKNNDNDNDKNNSENSEKPSTVLRHRDVNTVTSTSNTSEIKTNNRNERITSLVDQMRAKQIDHEKKQLNKAKYNRLKPYLVSGGIFLVSVLFMKFYRNFLSDISE